MPSGRTRQRNGGASRRRSARRSRSASARRTRSVSVRRTRHRLRTGGAEPVARTRGRTRSRN